MNSAAILRDHIAWGGRVFLLACTGVEKLVAATLRSRQDPAGDHEVSNCLN
jgi:hypothetical protein